MKRTPRVLCFDRWTMDETPQTVSCRCCIVGGGPAGMILGFLLARAGVDTIVLEKHADFFRDFRGDTIHPSTLEAMHDLGLLDDFLKLPHQEVRLLTVKVGDIELPLADFSHLPTHAKFLAFMPQWDFLDFISAQAKRYPCFRLEMSADASGLTWEQDRVVGVTAITLGGLLGVHGSDHWRRWPPFPGAAGSASHPRGDWCADGCALVPAVAQGR
jgi:FAD binding domain